MSSTYLPFVKELFLTVVIALFCQHSAGAAERPVDAEQTQAPIRVTRVATIGYVTWWSHDAVGYHPAILLKLENTTGTNLSGVIIRFQGRFTDLRNGYVTVARKEMRSDFAPHQQITQLLRGPTPFELPIDENAWPVIECKAMCRIGDVGDEGTQDLVVTRLDPVTMTDEEALSQLTRQTGVGRVSSRQPSDEELRRHRTKIGETIVVVPTKALMATAGNLLGTRAKTNNNEGDKKDRKISSLNIPSSLPALGDDFYVFEKYFGLPGNQCIVPSKNDVTWVGYPGKHCFTNIIVGSRGASGKADLIIATIPSRLSPKESQLMSLAKTLAGKASRTQSIVPFNHSVRYLSGGRSEVARSYQIDLKVLTFGVPPTGAYEGQTVLVVSRLPNDLEQLLLANSRRVQMLSFLGNGLAPD